MRRRGFTFVEVLIAVAVFSIVIVLALKINAELSVGVGMGTIDAALQTDARTLFGRLSEDAFDAHYAFTDDSGLSRFDHDADKKLVLIKIQVPESGAGAPPGGLYGQNAQHYFDLDGRTRQEWPVRRIVYSMESAGNQGSEPVFKVVRQESSGKLTRQESGTGQQGESTFTYSFQETQQVERKQMAENVAKLEFVPLAFVPKDPAQAADRPRVDASVTAPQRLLTVYSGATGGAELHHIAGLGVHYRAVDKRKSSKEQEGVMEILTKVWMEARTLGYRYDRAFSFTDERLGF